MVRIKQSTMDIPTSKTLHPKHWPATNHVKLLFLFEEKTISIKPMFLNVLRSYTIRTLRMTLLNKLKKQSNKISQTAENTRMLLVSSGRVLSDEITVAQLMKIPISYLNVKFQNIESFTLTVKIPLLGKSLNINIALETESVEKLMTIIQDILGLSVSLFYLKETRKNCIMYHTKLIKDYKIKRQDLIIVEIIHGITKPYLLGILEGDISLTSENIVKFQVNPYLNLFLWRNALFTAAHFNYKEMTAAAIRSGINCFSPVGVHPSQKWCIQNSNGDVLRTPLHEAAARGSFQCLDMFSRVYPLSFFVKYKDGITPTHLAKRHKQRKCWTLLTVAEFKLAKFSLFSYSLYEKILRWSYTAKEKVRIYRIDIKQYGSYYHVFKGKFTFDQYNTVRADHELTMKLSTSKEPAVKGTTNKTEKLLKSRKVKSRDALEKAKTMPVKSYLKIVRMACELDACAVKETLPLI